MHCKLSNKQLSYVARHQRSVRFDEVGCCMNHCTESKGCSCSGAILPTYLSHKQRHVSVPVGDRLPCCLLVKNVKSTSRLIPLLYENFSAKFPDVMSLFRSNGNSLGKIQQSPSWQKKSQEIVDWTPLSVHGST